MASYCVWCFDVLAVLTYGNFFGRGLHMQVLSTQQKLELNKQSAQAQVLRHLQTFNTSINNNLPDWMDLRHLPGLSSKEFAGFTLQFTDADAPRREGWKIVEGMLCKWEEVPCIHTLSWFVLVQRHVSLFLSRKQCHDHFAHFHQ